MSSTTFPRAASLLCISFFALSACSQGDTPTAVDHLSAHGNHGVDAAAASSKAVAGKPGAMLMAAKAATSRFHSTVQAERAGHVPDPHCVSHPQLGAMGHHWVNMAIVDPVFDPARPEAVLYAPGEGKQMKLVAVEYIVIDVGQPRPSFDGHLFDIGGVPPLMAANVPHWSLHVWVHESNPNGLYTPFNPNVSCN